MGNEDDKRLGLRFRALREAAGISQAQLAARASERGLGGIYPQTITKIENGDRSLKFTEAAILTEAMSSNLQELNDLSARPMTDAETGLMAEMRSIRTAFIALRRAVGQFVIAKANYERQLADFPGTSHPQVRNWIESTPGLSVARAVRDGMQQGKQNGRGDRDGSVAQHELELLRQSLDDDE